MHSPRQHRRVVIRVGCCPTPLQRLQSFLGALNTKAPHVETDVVHLPTGEQLRRLAAGELDLGVIECVEVAPPLMVEPLYTGEPAIAVVPLTHALADRPVIATRDLADETLLVPPRAVTPAVHDAVVASLSDGASPGPRVRAVAGADPRDMVFAVAQGHGIALVPRSTLQQVGELAGLVIGCPLGTPVAMPDNALAWHDGSSDAPSEVVTAARAAARELRAFSERR